MDGYIDINMCLWCTDTNIKHLFGCNDRRHGTNLYTWKECTGERAMARCYRIFNYIHFKCDVYAGLGGNNKALLLNDSFRFQLWAGQLNSCFFFFFIQNSKIFSGILLTSLCGIIGTLIAITTIRGNLKSWQSMQWLPKGLTGVWSISLKLFKKKKKEKDLLIHLTGVFFKHFINKTVVEQLSTISICISVWGASNK